jgi:hypothetical protein
MSICDNFDSVMSYHSLITLAAQFTIQLTDIHRNGLQFFMLYNIVSVAMSLIWCTTPFRLFPNLVHVWLRVMQQVTEYICMTTHLNFSDWNVFLSPWLKFQKKNACPYIGFSWFYSLFPCKYEDSVL